MPLIWLYECVEITLRQRSAEAIMRLRPSRLQNANVARFAVRITLVPSVENTKAEL